MWRNRPWFETTLLTIREKGATYSPVSQPKLAIFHMESRFVHHYLSDYGANRTCPRLDFHNAGKSKRRSPNRNF
jgi:hypothetical protein